MLGIEKGVDEVRLAGGRMLKEKLERGLVRCIGRLVKAMEGKSIDVDEHEGKIEGVFLRALVEIVRGCEEGGFSAAK